MINKRRISRIAPILLIILVIMTSNLSVFAVVKRTDFNDKISQIDSKIVDIVNQDSPNPEMWWEWYFQLPIVRDEYVDQTDIMEWLEEYSKIELKIDRQKRNYNPLMFNIHNNYRTKSVLSNPIEMQYTSIHEDKGFDIFTRASKMVTGGSEHPYNFSLWKGHELQANCYAYVLNMYFAQNFDSRCQPGVSAGYSNDFKELTTNSEKIYKRVHADMPYFNGKKIRTSYAGEKPGYREYKVALVIAPNRPVR